MLNVDVAKGLSAENADERRVTFGDNALPDEKTTPFWKLVLGQFNDTLVQILLAAAGISFSMALLENNPADFVEPFIILLILTLNAIVGVLQENKAEEAIEALKKYAPENAHVLRNGTMIVAPSEQLVPGDIVEVSVGNRVPADIRVGELHSTALRVDQSILTGESKEVLKSAEKEKTHSRFSNNIVYSGSSVVYGKAIGVVVRTGSSTEIGLIERNVREQETESTPLQKKLDEFGVLLSKVIGYICLAVFAITMLRWFQIHEFSPEEGFFERYVTPTIHSLKVAVALAVAAIPEGLPAVVTTCLALGTQRMAKHNAIVRVLPSVETLGRCTVICSDKTGTLTTNKMSVQQVVTLGDDEKLQVYTLENTEFEPKPGCVKEKGVVKRNVTLENTAMEMLTATGTLCNDAALFYNESTGKVEKIGGATEAALLVMSEKLPMITPLFPEKLMRSGKK
ncbi:hypothetical protein AGDE_09121 [Angomonas deanei]|nr:hypothetical protein AGDE_09121 [Angomonas deanei]|eukprot:EPY31299.1 hypothetical protein AGDE_09121 [Angomonas deanei]